MNEPNINSIKEKIKNLAKKSDRGYSHLWNALVFERFLAKVSQSKHRDKFIFKGGLLLSQYVTLGRETADLDFLLKKIKGKKEKVLEVLEEILGVESSDFNFQIKSLKDADHEATQYIGFKARVLATWGNTKTPFDLDLAFGDTVDEMSINLSNLKYKDQSLIDEEITLFAYPPEFIFAEKFETVISKGEVNSRMKDFFDLILLIQSGSLNNEKLKKSIKSTFENRGTEMVSGISFPEGPLSSLGKHWDNFLNKLPNDKRIKKLENIQSVIKEINDFLRESK